jgi:hypothetical protein
VKGSQRTIGRTLGAFALAASVAMLLSGCSEVSFPAVHDMPSPRMETTLSPDQVKQATDDLICERDHLTNGAQAGVQAGSPAANTPGKPPSAPQKPCTPPAATTGSVVPASAYAKP